jgi:GAF domain-containing protein/CheY-like chemotaxis protein
VAGVLAALALAWAAGAAWLLRDLAARHEARADRSAEAARVSVRVTQQALVREARLLAQDPAIVEGVVKGDWATLARGASPRMVAVTVDRVADLLLVVDAAGVPLVQVPATPRLTRTDLAPPPGALGMVRPLGAQVYLLGVAPVRTVALPEPVGAVLVGRRLEHLGPVLEEVEGRPALVVIAGDVILGATRSGLPAAGWEAAARAGRLGAGSAAARLRRLDEAGLWALVPASDEAAERRRLVLLLTVTFVTAAASVVAAAWTRRRAPGTDVTGRDTEIEALSAVARAVAGGEAPGRGLGDALAHLCAVIGLDGGAVFRLDAPGGNLTPLTHCGLGRERVDAMVTAGREAGVVAEALGTGRLAVTPSGPGAGGPGDAPRLALPIHVGGAPRGVMVLFGARAADVAARRARLLEAVAHQVGLALARAELADEAREKSRRLEALTRLAQTLTTLSLDQVLQRVVDAAVGLFGASVSRLWLVDDDGESLTLRAEGGVRVPVTGVQRLRIGEGLAGAVAMSRAPLAVTDVLRDPRTRNVERIRAEGTVSFAGVPLLVGERLLGALWIATRERHEFTGEEMRLLQSLADHAAIAIDNARLFAEEQARREHLAALLEINKKIATVQTTEGLLTAIAEEAARLIGVDNAGFRLVEGDALVLAGLAGTAPQTMLRPRIRTGESLSGKVVAEGRTLTFEIARVPGVIPEHLEADRRLGYTNFLGTPLRIGDRTIGVLTFRARRAFTARDRELAEAFAGQAAIALEQARLYRERSSQARRMAALADVERLLSETLDPDVVARRIADSVCGLLEARSAALYRLDSEAALLALTALSEAAEDGDWATDLPLGRGLVGLAARDREAKVTADVLADPRVTLSPERRARNERSEQRALLAVPLRVQDRVLGVLGVRDRTGRPFTPEDIRLAQAFADQAAIALENARLHEETERRRREAEELARLARTLTESLDVAAVCGRIVDSIGRLFPSASAGLRLAGPDGSLAAIAYAGDSRGYFRPGNVLPPGVGIAGRALAEGRPVWTADILADPGIVLTDELRALLTSSGHRAFLAVPLRAKGQVLGVLTLAEPAVRSFREPEIALLQAFADQAALALDNARLHAETEQRRREAEVLAAVAGSIGASLDLDTVLQRVVEGARELAGSDTARIALREPGSDRFRFRYSGGLLRQSWQEVVIEPGKGTGGQVLLTGRPFRTDNYLDDPRISPDYLALAEREGQVAMLVVPIRIGDRVEGLLYADRRAPRPFTEREEGVLVRLAEHAAVAIRNAGLYREAREYGERLRALDEVNRLVSSSLKMDEVLRNIAAAVARLLDAPHVSLWEFDPERGRLRRSLTHAAGPIASDLPDELPPGLGGVGWAVLHREPLLWTDIERDERIVGADAMLQCGLRYLTAYPIAIGDRVLGAFSVCRAVPAPITPETAVILASLAAQAAVAMDHARLYAETTRRLEQTRALLEVAAVLNSTLESEHLLERAARKIAEVCRVDRCALERWEGWEIRPLTVQFADGRDAAASRAAFARMAAAPFEALPLRLRVRDDRRPVVVEDAAASDLIPAQWAEALGARAIMMVPLLRQDHVIGAMLLDRCERPGGFEPWQAELAAGVAGQLALSLENLRLFAEAHERLRETTTLLAVAQAFSQPGPVDEAMRRVASEVCEAFGADTVGAYVVDERGEELSPLVGYRVPEELYDLFRRHPIVLSRFPFVREAAASGSAAWSDDAHHDPRFDEAWVRRLPPHSVLFAPTRVRGAMVGGLFLVWWRPGRAFPPAEIRLIEGVATQVGLALENAELARQRELRLAETETLLAVSRALSTLDVDLLIRHLLRQVARAVRADCVGIFTVEGDGEWLRPTAAYRMRPEFLPRARTVRLSTVQHPFYAEAARTGRAVCTADAPRDPRIPGSLLEAVPHRAELFAPIRVKDRMIAAFIAVWWDEPREFSAAELSLVEAIASQAGVALENARLFQENRQRVQELSVLHRVSRAITGELDRDALLATIRAEVPRVLDAEKVVVLLLDEQGDEVEVALRYQGGVERPEPRRYPRRTGLLPVVLETRRAFRTDDYRGECERRGLPLPPDLMGPRHWIGAPMIAGDAVLGVLTASRDSRPFTDADERLVNNIADLAALALRSARLYEERTRAYGELAATQDHLVRTEKLRALGEMASGVAHDFNNLLAAILGRSQLLLRSVEDPKLRQWLQVIERAASDGAQTVRRLQEFARVRRDQPRVAVDLNEIVRDALELTQSRWREEALRRGVVIEVDTRLVPLPPVAGDPAELREAMTNLILNAVDAMPSGGALTLATAVVEGGVEVTVSDTGVGIPEEVRDRIFDPFFTTKGPQGTGLGLSITYGILSRHGATVSVESAVGQGTTFRLLFPPVGATAPAANPPGEALEPPRALRCLVVDDEAAVGAVIGDVLETAGHSAVVVGDGAAAIQRFRAEPFDVVLTDLAMPGVSGWEVAAAVRAAAPDVPIFVVTGFGVEVAEEERRAHGVAGVFTKPVKIQELLEAITRVASRHARTSGGEEP